MRLYIAMLNSKIKEFGHEKNNKKENKIMLNLFKRRHLTAQSGNSLDRRDPLAHPAIQRMSPRELADLPFNRR